MIVRPIAVAHNKSKPATTYSSNCAKAAPSQPRRYGVREIKLV
jgi:hypothetical protein